MIALREQLIELIERARAAERTGALDDALYWFDHALRDLGRDGDPADAADLLRWIGTVHRQRGDLQLASDVYEASATIAELNRLTRASASAENCMAVVAQSRGEMEKAQQLYTAAKALAEQAGDQRLAAMIDQNLGTLANTRGEIPAAISNYLSALGRFRSIGDHTAATLALNNLGMAHVDLSDWESADACFDEAFAIAGSLGDARLLGMIELNRAELHLKRKDFVSARDCCDRAFEIHLRQNSRALLGEAFKFYGVLYREMQRPGLAETNLRQAVGLALAAEARLLEAEAQTEWALLELQLGRNQEALHRLNRAHGLFEELHARNDLIDINQRLDRLEANYLRVVQHWAESIESADPYTAGHCARVADYASALARAVGYAGRDLTWFRMGGFLHDVGKTAVPREVLNKPDKLSPEEWSLMQTHITVGDRIVAELNFPWNIRPMVRSHHEHWDGTGYPDRLEGDAIPHTARILCVADVYDALTTARSYRRALSQEEALGIMERDAGRIFDPTLFEVFRRLVAPGRVAAA